MSKDKEQYTGLGEGRTRGEFFTPPLSTREVACRHCFPGNERRMIYAILKLLFMWVITKYASASWIPGAYPPLDVDAQGRGGTQHSFIRGGSAPRSKPLSFYIPFLMEKGTPFVYLLLTTGTRTRNLKLELELCILLTTVNTLSSKYSINHKKTQNVFSPFWQP